MLKYINRRTNRIELAYKPTYIKRLGANVKKKGLDNNLLELIAEDDSFNMTLDELKAAMDPSKYVGRAPYQVDVFLKETVNPVLEANKDLLGLSAEINV